MESKPTAEQLPFTVHGTKKGGIPIGTEKRKHGRVVTVVRNVRGQNGALLRAMQRSIGCGGSAVNFGEVELQGEHVILAEAFLRDMMPCVDVRDLGAIGDGVADDRAAFQAADDAAEGRIVMVPSGTFRIDGNLTLVARLHCHAKL